MGADKGCVVFALSCQWVGTDADKLVKHDSSQVPELDSSVFSKACTMYVLVYGAV